MKQNTKNNDEKIKQFHNELQALLNKKGMDTGFWGAYTTHTERVALEYGHIVYITVDTEKGIKFIFSTNQGPKIEFSGELIRFEIGIIKDILESDKDIWNMYYKYFNSAE